MADIDISAASRVRDLFFSAAINSATWENALNALAELFNGWGATLVIVDKETGRPSAGWLSGRWDPQGMQNYLTYYGRLDPAWPIVGAQTPLGQIGSCGRFISNEFVRRSEFYQDFLIPEGGRFLTGGRLLEDENEIVGMSVHTGERRGPLEDRQLAVLQSIWPSLMTAIQVWRKLARANVNTSVAELSGMLMAFERMSCAGIVIDQIGRVLFMNAQAKQHLDCIICVEKGRLVARHRASNTNLQRIIAATTVRQGNIRGETVAAIARPSGRPLIAYLMAININKFANFGPRSPAAIILLIDPDAERPLSEEVLSQIFKLTAAEIRLANAIARGLSVNEAANELEIGYETARTGLKVIFNKTDVHRQSELVGLLRQITILPK